MAHVFCRVYYVLFLVPKPLTVTRTKKVCTRKKSGGGVGSVVRVFVCEFSKLVII